MKSRDIEDKEHLKMINEYSDKIPNFLQMNYVEQIKAAETYQRQLNLKRIRELTLRKKGDIDFFTPMPD